MKDWQDFPDDDELDRADDLLGQADALLRRHRGDTAAPPARTPPGSPGPAEPVRAMPPPLPSSQQAFDDDDLPILTEVVEDVDLPAEIFLPVEPSAFVTHPPATTSPAFIRTPLQPTPPTEAVLPAATQPGPTSQPPSSAAAEQQLAERLVELDTAIAREIDEWAARELPQIIARELDRLGERIQGEALAHLRATLLPGISARVSSLFEDRSPDDPPAP